MFTEEEYRDARARRLGSTVERDAEGLMGRGLVHRTRGA